MTELSTSVKNSFAKIERKIDDKFAMYEKKLDDVIKLTDDLQKNIENLNVKNYEETLANENKFDKQNRNIDKHHEAIKGLEKDTYNLENMINKIDDNIEDANKKISESLIKIGHLEKEQQKQCMFDRKGYCREEDKCRFFHSKEICNEHIENVICVKTSCRK